MSEQDLRERLQRVVSGYPRVTGTEEQMAGALLGVLDLHKQESWEDLLGGPPAPMDKCRECEHDGWPCPTVRLILERMSGGTKP